MARTKQTETENSESNVEIMDESNIESETTEITPEQACSNLKMLFELARSKEADLTCIKTKFAIQERMPIHSEEYIATLIKNKATLETEKKTVMGEISLVHCPIETCNLHNPKSNTKKNENNVNLKKDLETVIDKVKSKQLKRAGDEEFKLPKKAARTIQEIPIDRVVCTTGNKFSVLEEEEVPPGKSSNPPAVKPIMLKIVNGYNLIVQDINRRFPGTVNKMAGNYIKVQPATPDDHRDIVTHLENIQPEHYIIKRLADRPIKVVIKGLPVKTDVADIEADLISQGFAVEKVAQLRKFSTKEPLPIFMVEVRRTETAGLIHDVKTVCYLCVTIDPFLKKPGATQCYNCNYFNHSSKNCRMTPRCLKCGKDHRTEDCTIAGKIEKPRCINCNQEGHVASLRSCMAFPKIKPKKGEAQNNDKPKNAQKKIIPAPRPVEANVSFANVCSGKINQQMETPGEITALKSQESPRLTTQSEGASPTNETNVDFGSFAMYIAELQNITAKFPEIFQALEDMSKETNDINKLNIFLKGVARSFNKAQK
ncbi:nucleic-acid-binding protein from transposon X-element [Trichonephila clavipes]|nr:nucleic-acid-binding protein from transposon X-element [Trichonephila clavipes]